MSQTFQILIKGQVQGVGFRPFVYSLASKHELNGTVVNDNNGVLIKVNCDENSARKFKEDIERYAPIHSVIQSTEICEVAPTSYEGFVIEPTRSSSKVDSPLTPDFAICDECKAEISDVENRRFGYAFTTCTNCGPRYSITTQFPFEREHTTISDFEMCAVCSDEYSDPGNRRFHSQTNSCPECGVTLKLTDSIGVAVDKPQELLIGELADRIRSGAIVAVKNTNGYLLCCDASNPAVITKLRQRKKRPTKPFALLYPSLKRVEEDFVLSDREANSLASPVAPIVVLTPKQRLINIASDDIAPGLHRLGVMLPSTALLTLLMNELQSPIVATSGNIHGSPIISEEADAIDKLKNVADYFLHHNLRISFPQDDSVIQFSGDQRIILRRARGLSPNYLTRYGRFEKGVLAMGAHLKSTFTFVPNSHVYVSPYFGNLDSYDVAERFRDSLSQFTRMFETTPATILMDAHPNYQSTVLGEELVSEGSTESLKIQHHKAHFASVLGEHDLFDSDERIIGVIWDGTGLGDDDAIWGGEFFLYHNAKISRVSHMEYFDWIAGDKMAREPRLSLLSTLPTVYREVPKDKFTPTEWSVYSKIVGKDILKTSSVGRLFDAVSSLLGLIDINSYEGEAAMRLEACALRYSGEEHIDFLEGESFDNVPVRWLLGNIYERLQTNKDESSIAASFIYTLAKLIISQAQKYECKTIACSGGVFQNKLLVDKLLHMAQNQGLQLKFNCILSSNDENISFGQLCYFQHVND